MARVKQLFFYNRGTSNAKVLACIYLYLSVFICVAFGKPLRVYICGFKS